MKVMVNISNLNRDKIINKLNTAPVSKRVALARVLRMTPQTIQTINKLSSWIISVRYTPLTGGNCNITIRTDKKTYDLGGKFSINDFWEQLPKWRPKNGLGRWLWNTIWAYKRTEGGIGGVQSGFQTDYEKRQSKGFMLANIRMKQLYENSGFVKKLKQYKTRLQKYQESMPKGDIKQYV